MEFTSGQKACMHAFGYWISKTTFREVLCQNTWYEEVTRLAIQEESSEKIVASFNC